MSQADPPLPIAALGIAVDDLSNRKAAAHFVTHFAPSPMRGIEQPGWAAAPVYASQATAALIAARYPHISSMLRPLALNVAHAIGIPGSLEAPLKVTLIDANHCPGSSMFLFEPEEAPGILFTGPFRLHDDMLDHPALVGVAKPCVYLDNTFGTQSAPTFPTKRQATDLLLNALARYPSDVPVSIVCDHELAYAELLVSLARKLDSRIAVSDAFLQSVRALQDPAVPAGLFCSANQHETRICVIREAEAEFPRNGVVVLVGGWHGATSKAELELVALAHERAPLPRKLRVPFSPHSSFDELCVLLGKLSPSSLVLCVQPDMEAYEALSPGAWKALAPSSVQRQATSASSHGSRHFPLLSTPREREQRLSFRRRFRINSDVQVAHVVKRTQLVPWTAREDADVRELRRCRESNDEARHGVLRTGQLSERTDEEIAERSRMLCATSAVSHVPSTLLHADDEEMC